jgi:acetyl-CoA C-acetyltransferase
MPDAVIVSAVRTPIGRHLGALAGFSAPRLGAIAVRDAVRRSGVDPAAIDEVILGNVVSAGLGQNPARQAARAAELPDSVPAFTVNKVCGSGLKAVALAAQAIRAGDAEIVVAGGMESMSNAPFLLPDARRGRRLGHGRVLDAMVHDGLWDVYNDYHMGMTAENVAGKYGVTREQQDAFALRSHRRAADATQHGRFLEEIVAIESQDGGAGGVVMNDEGPRGDTSLEKLAALAPAFKPGGTVTAGNASQISDGAAALVLMSEARAARQGIKPLARVLGAASGGVAPEWVMMAPVAAIRNLRTKLGARLEDFDRVELNEAFAAAAVALQRELALPDERLNVRGGAVALGHPIGASGARILVTLLYILKQENAKRGLAALCLGGGNAVALAVENLGGSGRADGSTGLTKYLVK